MLTKFYLSLFSGSNFPLLILLQSTRSNSS